MGILMSNWEDKQLIRNFNDFGIKVNSGKSPFVSFSLNYFS